ncbi:EamA family transporter [Sphingobacterium detergens]|uniref:Drug/metabolite transporter (DMT)-like permease n=1 Tax=Sphingobacterium detergens TaxID=1145106 RepID=A0A420BHG7_SPHD1|nr:EamA family transporter [Sphingobacterium detergens]RKE56139.1 drug/metabolite transporter (DMT)-like permease [Sphingobacterium detergens]
MLQGHKKAASPLMVVVAYFIIYVVWGSTFFFIEKALHSFPPFILGSFRFVTASAILMSYCAIKGYKLFNKRSILEAAFVGFLLLFVDMAGVIWAEQYVSGGVAAIIAAAAAIWFILLDKPKWKENFSSVTTVAGVVLGFIGVVMLFAEQIMASNDNANGNLKIIALCILVLGSIAWTVGSLASKYFKKSEAQEKEDLHVMVKTAWQMVTAGVLFNITALFTGEYASFELSSVAPVDWFNLAYLITFGSILAFSSYIWLLQVRPAMEVSTYAYVNPIIALILSHFFTSHAVTSLQIVGLAVILLSVLLMNWKAYRTKLSTKNKNKKILQGGTLDTLPKHDDRQTTIDDLPEAELVH